MGDCAVVLQACYTAGAILPRPVNSIRYYHRSLNPKKLIDIKFSRLAPKQKMRDAIRKYAVDRETEVALVPLEDKHCEQACALLNTYLNKSVLRGCLHSSLGADGRYCGRFDMVPVFSLEDFKHWLLPREGVIKSYVVEVRRVWACKESRDLLANCAVAVGSRLIADG